MYKYFKILTILCLAFSCQDAYTSSKDEFDWIKASENEERPLLFKANAIKKRGANSVTWKTTPQFEDRHKFSTFTTKAEFRNKNMFVYNLVALEDIRMQSSSKRYLEYKKGDEIIIEIGLVDLSKPNNRSNKFFNEAIPEAQNEEFANEILPMLTGKFFSVSESNIEGDKPDIILKKPEEVFEFKDGLNTLKKCYNALG